MPPVGRSQILGVEAMRLAHGQEGDGTMGFFRKLFRSRGEAAIEHSERGVAAYEQGDYERAIAEWSEALRLDPDNADTYVDRSWAYIQRGQHDKAIADCTSAIGLRPESEAYNNRGIAYAAKREHDEALADFTEAIRLRPLGTKAYLNRGQLYRQRGGVRAFAGRLHGGDRTGPTQRGYLRGSRRNLSRHGR
jgi:tetratricopeptide (TPR) repeat protein